MLAQHPNVEIVTITSRGDAGTHVADMFPNLRGHLDLVFKTPAEAPLKECDVVFFATPHGVAMNQAKELLEAGVKIIDLAADFRLRDLAMFEKWYKMPHSCPDVLEESVYGLSEVYRDSIRQARVVGNPGCYPTTVILGLAPLLKPALIDLSDIISDSKSGVTGAGRKAELGILFSEVSDSFKAYGVSGHRHHPEVTEQLQRIAGQPVNLTFVPHLVPMVRGMFSTLYVRLNEQGRNMDVQALYENFYKSSNFVDVLPAGSLPDTRSVRASNMLRIALHKPATSDRLIILVVQDNLVKGASGQAIQNMNLMFGLEETTGLSQVAILP